MNNEQILALLLIIAGIRLIYVEYKRENAESLAEDLQHQLTNLRNTIRRNT